MILSQLFLGEREQALMVKGGEGLEPSLRPRHYDCLHVLKVAEQVSPIVSGQKRHVTRGHGHPIVRGVRQGGVQPAQTAAWVEVRMDGHAEVVGAV